MKALRLEKIGLIPILLVFQVILFGILQPKFLMFGNMQNIMFQTGILALAAFGQFFPVLAGGIDFSVGGQIALTSIILALAMPVYGFVGGIIVALLSCMLVGLINGAIVVKFKASPMVITLGMQWVVNGVTLMLSNGQVIYGIPESFRWFGIGRIAGIPVTLLWAAIGFIACYVFLYKTVYGKHLYALGANERFAYLAGIPVGRRKILAYVVCCFFTAIAAFILTGALGSGQSSLGSDIAMQNFIAVFIAGTRWGGGEGSITTVAFGALFVAVLQNGLNILNVSSFIQLVISGLVLVFALTVDMMRRRGLTLGKLFPASRSSM